MTDQLAQVIFAIGSVITAIAGLVTAVGVFLNLRATKVGAAISKDNSATLVRVEQHTNGMQAKAEAIARAVGVDEGHESGVITGIDIGARQERSRAAVAAEAGEPIKGPDPR